VHDADGSYPDVENGFEQDQQAIGDYDDRFDLAEK
jgi:hypothetical protein